MAQILNFHLKDNNTLILLNGIEGTAKEKSVLVYNYVTAVDGKERKLQKQTKTIIFMSKCH